MSDLQETEIEFETIVKELDIGIKNLLRNKIDVAGNSSILQNRLARAKQVLRSYKLDYRELPKDEQKPYSDKAHEYEERIKTIEIDLNWAEKNADGVGSPITQTKTNNNSGVLTQNDETQQILDQGKRIQKEDLRRLGGVVEQVNQIIDIGTSTREEMAVQEEKMKNIQKSMDEVDGNLKLATRQMRAFARKMATDKIIMGFILLIIIAIIFVIVYTIVRPKSNPKVAERIIPE